jgi:DNA-binding response OmpR family regulator
MNNILFYTTIENDMVYPYLLSNRLEVEYITDFGVLSRVSRDNLNQIIVLHSEDEMHLKSAAITLKRFSPSCLLIGLFDVIESCLSSTELFEAGFFDIFKYPYDVDTLLACIKTRLALNKEKVQEVQNVRLQLTNAVFNPVEHVIVAVDGSFETLTTTQAKVLQLLLTNGNAVTTRASMLRAIWGSVDFYKSRSLDSVVTALRKIVTKYGIQIETIRGLGFYVTEIKTLD